MKRKIGFFALLAAIVFTFYGCPVGLEYPLGVPGTEAIDTALIGSWTIKEGQEREVMKLKVSKRDETSYTVEVIEQGTDYRLDSTRLSGWVTSCYGEKFFFVQNEEGGYHHYHYELTGKNRLVVHDMLLFDGGAFAVSSTETLRKQLGKSMKHKDWGINKTEYLRAWKDGKQ